jgi:hypothetical protein
MGADSGVGVDQILTPPRNIAKIIIEVPNINRKIKNDFSLFSSLF